MARIRSVKPEYWQDQKIAAELSRDQRLLYIALWNEADDDGRFIAHPRRLLGVTFPYDDDLDEQFIEDSLRALAETNRVVLYDFEGEQYGQLTKFQDHQRINRPTPSKLPSPNDVGASLRAHGGISEGSVLEQGTGSREQGTGSGRPAPEDELGEWLGEHNATMSGCPLAWSPQIRDMLFQHYGPPGLRANAWMMDDGSKVAEAERPRLLTLAVTGYAAEGKREIITNEFAKMLKSTIRGEVADPGSKLSAYLSGAA